MDQAKTIYSIPRYFTQKGIIVFFLVLLIVSAIFFQKVLPLYSVLFNLIEVVGFFSLSSSLSIKWSRVSVKYFTKRLLQTAFGIRLAWVFFSYFFYIHMTGIPFEFDASDSSGYHGEGQWLVDLLHRGAFDRYLVYIGTGYSDMGYPLYLGLLYYAVGDSVLLPRIIKAALGAVTCLFIYKIARNNFGESTGRVAGIMAMLLPNLIYYCGLHVKETEMLFLIVSFIYLADLLLRSNRIHLKYLLLLAILGASLFFFRTVLAVCVITSVAVAVVFTTSRISSRSKRFGLIILLIAGAFLISKTSLSESINDYIEAGKDNQQLQMSNFSNRKEGNKFASYGSLSVFLPLILIAPFPTLVDTGQQNSMMLGGAFFTRNIYAFFVLLALWALYKQRKLSEHVLLLAALGSYSLVLASSGFALSERFHLPMVPLLLIFAAYGVSQVKVNHKPIFIFYVVVVSIIVIGWNWFKLAGRS